MMLQGKLRKSKRRRLRGEREGDPPSNRRTLQLKLRMRRLLLKLRISVRSQAGREGYASQDLQSQMKRSQRATS